MTKFQRVYEAAILRTLGASTRLLGAMLALEYSALGLLAGAGRRRRRAGADLGACRGTCSTSRGGRRRGSPRSARCSPWRSSASIGVRRERRCAAEEAAGDAEGGMTSRDSAVSAVTVFRTSMLQGGACRPRRTAERRRCIWRILMVTHEIIGDDMQAVVLTLARRRRGPRRSGRADVHDRRDRDGRQDGWRPARRPEAQVPRRREPVHHLFPGTRGAAPRSRSPGRIPEDHPDRPERPASALPAATRSSARSARSTSASRSPSGSAPVSSAGKGSSSRRWKARGELFIHSGGTIVPFDLEAGRAAQVDTGCLVAFDPTVDYDIVRVGGIKTALFGGEGLFFASLTGPGRVWLQTLPFSRLAERIHAAYQGRPGGRQARLRRRARAASAT